MPASNDLRNVLARFSVAEHLLRPDGEEWKAMIERISTPGKIADIDEEAFWYFLEVLPPKYQSGSCFAFAEGAEEFRLFWRSGGQHFCRQLTWDETKEFCQHARMHFPYWD